MGSQKTRKYLDATVAALVLLSSGVLTALAYQQVSRSAVEARIPLGKISSGKTFFHILQKENCVGEFELLFEQQELVRLRLEMDLRVDVYGKLLPFHLQAEGFFNPMGQMVRSATELNALSSSFLAKSQDVYPIHLEVNIRSPQTSYEQELEVPGPVLLMGDSKKGFYLEYPELKKFFPQSYTASLSEVKSQGELRLFPLEKEAKCGDAQQGVKLTELNLSRFPFSNQLQNLLAGARLGL